MCLIILKCFLFLELFISCNRPLTVWRCYVSLSRASRCKTALKLMSWKKPFHCYIKQNRKLVFLICSVCVSQFAVQRCKGQGLLGKGGRGVRLFHSMGKFSCMAATWNESAQNILSKTQSPTDWCRAFSLVHIQMGTRSITELRMWHH